MCTGHDGVPLKILRDSVLAIITHVKFLMELACKSIPLSWKKSVVIPLHKGKSRTDVGNYRPISNLVSISKLFEKIVLKKINERYPGIEGPHQHGFRTRRSTVSALLELQHHKSSSLDKNKHISTYSVDMSAAFDLLRPGLFHGLDIEEGLMNILLDFMTGRTFRVKVGNALSEENGFSVGCVQGSILGPKLFNIYCANIQKILPTYASIVSYADNSYVVIAADTKDDLTAKTEECFKMHAVFLDEIGMVVNKDKTEMLYSSRTKSKNEELEIHVEDTRISKRINFDWLDINISKDSLRTKLKSAFLHHSLLA
jgi:hypothetical protein